MKKYINRSIEPIVKKISKQFPVIVVTGPRQSGKSTMIRHLFDDYEFITFDNLETRMRAKKDPALFVDSLKNPVVLDEIQYVPEILPYIKINVDEYTTTMRHDEINGKFILTGSQIFTLMAGLTETLAGRIALFELLPFSFEELGKKPHDVISCYWQLMKGFYPNLNTEENRDTSASFRTPKQVYKSPLKFAAKEEVSVNKIANRLISKTYLENFYGSYLI
jgi:predicted AAA+ superfamily ATPase